MSRGRILVGTCNWADHKGFYPAGLPAGERLAHYAHFFPLVEVDTTFYGVPKASVVERWAEITPPGFVFNVKAHKSLTYHEREDGKPRRFTPDEEKEFVECLGPLREAGKLRAVHYQFPPWFTARPDNLNYLAEIRERHPDDDVIVEMRHRSWGEKARFEQLCELLTEARMTYAVVDEPHLGSGSMPGRIAVTNPNLAVVRMHGRNYKTWYEKGAKSSADRFDYLYVEEELLEWVPRIRGMADRANEVQVLFNNNRSNYAVVNGLQMAKLLDLDYPDPATVPALVEGEQEAFAFQADVNDTRKSSGSASR
jgi:uncharacterized protein YecE (DUF72 family)